MQFTSLYYAGFLAVVFLLIWNVKEEKRWIPLLIANYFFYMNLNVAYAFLLLAITAVTYYGALLIEKNDDRKRRRGVLIVSVGLVTAVLVFFKYFAFAVNSVIGILSLLGMQVDPFMLNVLQPVGISFYIFMAIGYTADVYMRRIEAEHNFGIFASFLSFFPTLLSGPIERGGNLLPQIKKGKKFSNESASEGLMLILWGLYKKLAIADVLAPYVNMVYKAPRSYRGFELLLAIFFYSVQIYCDFSGYSDIAIGSAKLLGFDLKRNFAGPYLAGSVKEFWSRWHISLSTWFRDYVYIPLGGSRCSKIKRDRNLMVTFLLSGLWHGAAWTFVIWGGLHGAMQVAENHILKKQERNGKFRPLRALVVFALASLAWVFFRAASAGDAIHVILHCLDGITRPAAYFRNNQLALEMKEFFVILLTIGLLFIYDLYERSGNVFDFLQKRKRAVRWAVYILVIFVILLRMPTATNTEFLYFKF